MNRMDGWKHRKRTNEKSSNRRLLWVCSVILLVVVICFGVMYAQKIRQDRGYPLHYQEIILWYAKEYQLDPYAVCGVIHTESRFRAEVVSSAGARGLMQVMPDTGAWIAQKLGITDFDPDQLFDPDTNIRMGCWYLNYLFSLFPDRPDVVYAAYNTGPGRIGGWLKQAQYNDGEGNLINIPVEATRRYVEKVNHGIEQYRKLYTLDET